MEFALIHFNVLIKALWDRYVEEVPCCLCSLTKLSPGAQQVSVIATSEISEKSSSRQYNIAFPDLSIGDN